MKHRKASHAGKKEVENHLEMGSGEHQGGLTLEEVSFYNKHCQR